MVAAEGPQVAEVDQGRRRAVGCAQNHDQEGDTESTTDLARCLIHRAAHGEALDVKARNGRRAENREGETDTESGDERGRQPTTDVGRMEADGGGVPGQPSGEKAETDEQDGAEPDALSHAAGRPRDDGHDQRSRGDGQAGPQDRVVPDAGQEQDVAQQHGEEAHGVKNGGGVSHAERAGAEQGQVEHRLGVARRAAQEGGPRRTRAPTKQAMTRPLDQPQVGPSVIPRTSAANVALTRRTPA